VVWVRPLPPPRPRTVRRPRSSLGLGWPAQHRDGLPRILPTQSPTFGDCERPPLQHYRGCWRKAWAPPCANRAREVLVSRAGSSIPLAAGEAGDATNEGTGERCSPGGRLSEPANEGVGWGGVWAERSGFSEV